MRLQGDAQAAKITTGEFNAGDCSPPAASRPLLCTLQGSVRSALRLLLNHPAIRIGRAESPPSPTAQCVLECGQNGQSESDAS